MLTTLFKHSIRTFRRQKSYLLINILGLSIGMACSVIIFLYVMHEWSFDRYHENRDQIYRIILNGKIGGQELNAASTTAVLGPTMVSDLPEVEACLRMNDFGNTVVRIEEQTFIEEHALEADSTFFRFFSILLLRGDAAKVLTAPYQCVLSENHARKYFGEKDPIGKTLRVGTDPNLYTVTGVMKQIPDNTHFETDILLSFVTNPRSNNDNWLSNSFSTYVLLKPNSSSATVEEKLRGMVEKYIGPLLEQFLGATIDQFMAAGNKYGFFLQPLAKIHLDPDIQQMLKPATNPRYLYIMGSIGLIILIIAAINYMNLATAQSAKRAREVGIKKVAGSSRPALIRQFITESVLMAFVSMIIALVIMELTLPLFSNILNAELKLDYLGHWYTIPVLLLLTLFLGFISGTYPAFYLSNFKPISILKGNLRNGMKNGKLRSILVVFQFAVSIMLIIGTLVMYRQLTFIQNRSLGFEKENLMVVERAGALGLQARVFKTEVNRIPGVLSSSLSTAIPNRNNNNNGYQMEGRSSEETFLMNTSWADEDFLKTWQFEISNGRNFDLSYPTDSFACLVNESVVQNFNISDPLITRFIRPGQLPDGTPDYRQIVGVLKDFHHESLHSPVTPYLVLFRTDQFQFGYYTIRIDPGQRNEVIQAVEKVWKQFTNNDPLQYYFFDEDFDNIYREERQNAMLTLVFTILAILVATLGLFGLTSFTLVQRTKEIGVRKIMGASVTTIFSLILREIALLVSIATLIAWPLIYLISKNWLQNFHFRIPLSPIYFILGFMIAILIALLTISLRTLRAARANPAKALKYE